MKAEGHAAARRLALRLQSEFAARLSPERTRSATTIERYTVARLGWEAIVRLNRYLEFFGKLTSVVYAGFVVSLVLGVDWKAFVEQVVNAGAPVRGAVVLAVVIPTLLFVALHSLIGYSRWKLQRELWRRDVARLEGLAGRPTRVGVG